MLAHPFGRYGFAPTPPTPGFEFLPEGIRVDREGEPLIRFDQTLRGMHLLQTDGYWAAYGLLGGGKSPTRLRVSAFGPGLELYFEKGFSLTFQSERAPFISWAEGSVGPEVPTPKLNWAAFSWPEAKVPLVVATPAGEAAWQVVPRNGLWSLESVDQEFEGWIRIVLPLGIRPFETPTASELGRLASASLNQDGPLYGFLPRQRSTQVIEEGRLLLLRTELSQDGALVPPYLLQERAGAPKIQSETQTLRFPTPERTRSRLKGKVLEARMWIPRIPVGRAIVAREKAVPPVQMHPQPSVFARRSLSLLTAEASPVTVLAVQKKQQSWFAEADVTTAQATALRLPYDQSSKQMDWLSALGVGLSTVGKDTTPSTVSVLWSYDPFMGELSVPQTPLSRALWGVTSIVSNRPEVRWQLGTGLWNHVDSFKGQKDWASNFIRAALGDAKDPWWDALNSPARLLSGPRIFAKNEGGGYLLRWWANGPGVANLELLMPRPVRVVNDIDTELITLEQGEQLASEPVRVQLRVRALAKGEQKIHLKAIEGILPPIPKAQD